MIKKTFTSLAVVAALVSSASFAEDEKNADKAAALSTGMVEQINLVHKLIDLGDAKNDPIYLIAAAKLQKDLSVDTIAESKEKRDADSVLDRAIKLAGEREDISAIAEDIKAAKTKGYHGNYGNYTGYSFGSSCSGHCF